MLGKKSRLRVLERYTLSQNITQLEQLYQNTVPLAKKGYSTDFSLSKGA